jgi:hypothetical protein
MNETCLGGFTMTRRELLDQLMKKYSFEKSHAIIQIAIEAGYYDDKEVHVTVSETLAGTYFFHMYWKES